MRQKILKPPKPRTSINIRTKEEFYDKVDCLRCAEKGPRIPSRSALIRLLVDRAYRDLPPAQKKLRPIDNLS